MKSGMFQNLVKVFSKSSGKDMDLKYLLQKLAKDPSDLRLKLQIGKAYFRQKDISKGMEYYREVGEKYKDMGFNFKAVSVYREILQYSPGSVEFNEKLGDLFRKMGMIPEAVQQYQIVMNYHATRRNSGEVLSVCRKIIQTDPHDFKNRKRLAEIYQSQGMEEEALREYEKIAKQLRRDMEPLDVLAEVYEKLLLKRPKEFGMLKELCVFYLKLGQPQKALQRIQSRKLEKDPEFVPLFEKAQELKQQIEAKKSEPKH